MVNKTHTLAASDTKNRYEYDTLAAVERISQLLSLNNPKQSDTKINDELIASLSETRENRRALQVAEWEKARRRGQ